MIENSGLTDRFGRNAHAAFVAAGLAIGYVATVVASALVGFVASTNLLRLVRSLVSDEVFAGLDEVFAGMRFVVGNGVFLVIFAICVSRGFAAIRPSAPEKSARISGWVAGIVATSLILAPSVLLIPALALVGQLVPSAAALVRSGSAAAARRLARIRLASKRRGRGRMELPSGR